MARIPIPIPIACTLGQDDAAARVEEWRGLLQNDVDEVDVDGPHARLRLRDGAATLLKAADLAQREKQCCKFFTFHIEVGADALWLAAEVSPEAAEVLAGLVALKTAS